MEGLFRHSHFRRKRIKAIARVSTDLIVHGDTSLNGKLCSAPETDKE
jgi:hypothetical protein